jgi:hypothetical protein
VKKKEEPPSAHVVLDEEGKKLLAAIRRFGTTLESADVRRAVLAAFMRAEIVVEKEGRETKSIRAYVKVRGKDEYVVNPRLAGLKDRKE